MKTAKLEYATSLPTYPSGLGMMEQLYLQEGGLSSPLSLAPKEMREALKVALQDFLSPYNTIGPVIS